jgi:cytochrome c556
MHSKWVRFSLVAALGAAAIAISAAAPASADDKDEKLPTIKEIMKKGHNGTGAYLAKIAAEAKAGKWEDAQSDAKGLAYFGESLGKLTPPKGDKKSWEGLSKKYAAATAAVKKGADDMDAKAVDAGIGMIKKSCGACHGAHKGK